MENRTRKAQKVTWTGFIANLFLSLGKLMAGIFGHSAAMVADGVHSISDFVTDIIVIGFVGVSDKASDKDHRYGHGKYETFATLLVSLALIFAGIGICWSGIQNIIRSFSGEVLGQPSVIALIAAVISIVTKEFLYQYTLRVGKSINNKAVIANAWHHRSDALSSIGTFLGIGGAIFLGAKWRMLDPLAGVVVSFFIIRVAWKLGMPSVKELLETALPEEVEKEILDIVYQTPGVKDHHRLKTRKIGNNCAIDIHIKLDGNLSLTESHDIATSIEKKLYEKYGNRTHISIHMEPFKGTGNNIKGHLP
ncbi:MAG: cation transporter [Bacteroidales bacterium]|nr:cation transporter [Bacteroidales bacterium]